MSSRVSPSKGIARTGVALVAACLLAPVGAHAESLYSGSGPRPGPDVLYGAPAEAPQLTNAPGGTWNAQPILVSGAEAYRQGEFLYQDFLYDDHGARQAPDPGDPRTPDFDTFSQPNGTYTYPTASEYANNAADLVEFRAKPLADATAFRITLNTLKDPSLVAFSIALGGDPGTKRAFPDGAKARAPADLFLTVHPGASGPLAELVSAADGKAVEGPAASASIDLERRQLDVRVPHAAWDPGTSVVRMAMGVGLWDKSAGRYLVPGPAASATQPGGAGAASEPTAFFNAAFRVNEPMPQNNNATTPAADPRWWRDAEQGKALAVGDLTQLHADVDFAKLVANARSLSLKPRFRACRRCASHVKLKLPQVRRRRIVEARVTYGDKLIKRAHGKRLRRISVRRPTGGAFRLGVQLRTNALPPPDDESGVPTTGPIDRILPSRFETAQGADYTHVCLSAPDGCTGEYQGQLQPYGVYVPRKPAPSGGYGMTLLLHSLAGNYNQYLDSRNQSQFGERGPGSIVVTPEGRGPDGDYFSYAEADTFEVWADAARHYPLDPAWSVVTGYSMGGLGTFRLAERYPDLFARGQPTVGTDGNGMPENLRHIPMLMWNASTDELVALPLPVASAQALDALGYRYELDVFAPAEHLTLAFNDQFAPAADFLGTAKVDRDPAHVTFTADPAKDDPKLGLVSDHAYWVSDVKLRDTTPGVGVNAGPLSSSGDAKGKLDVVSHGFGVGDPTPSATQAGSGTLTGGSVPAIGYASTSKTWGAVPRTAVADQLDIKATNVAAVTVDPKRAKVDCDAKVNVQSDAPLKVTLAGCRVAPPSCTNKRSFSLKLRPPAGARVERAAIDANGRRLKTVEAARGKPLRKVAFRLGRKASGEVRVRVVLRIRKGGKTRSLTQRRSYVICAAG